MIPIDRVPYALFKFLTDPIERAADSIRNAVMLPAGKLKNYYLIDLIIIFGIFNVTFTEPASGVILFSELPPYIDDRIQRQLKVCIINQITQAGVFLFSFANLVFLQFMLHADVAHIGRQNAIIEVLEPLRRQGTDIETAMNAEPVRALHDSLIAQNEPVLAQGLHKLIREGYTTLDRPVPLPMVHCYLLQPILDQQQAQERNLRANPIAAMRPN